MAAWVSGVTNTSSRNFNYGSLNDLKASKMSSVECAVCGDSSSGKHYGVFTCEGCKSFFKRSIRRNLAYTCRSFQSCPIDINHRNQCQFCRLKKCVKVGMRKDAVQKGRLPKSPLEGSVVDQLLNNQMNVVQQQQQQQQPNISGYASMLMRADDITRLQQQQQQQQQQQFTLNGSGGASENNMYEIATRLLFSAVEWARNVPFFSALPTTDQIALLKSCWSELYLLNTSQHCSTYQISARNLLSQALTEGNVLNDQRKRLSPDESRLNDGSVKIFEELVERFKNLRTDAAEFSCLKALILFNPDSPGIGNPMLIESLQEKAQAALEEYLRRQASPNYANRFGKLLLRLPALSLIQPATIESLFFSRLVGNHNMDSLIGSLLIYGNNNNNNVPNMNGNMQARNTYGMNLNGHVGNQMGPVNNLGMMSGNLPIFCNENNIAINNMLNNALNNLPNGLQNTNLSAMQMQFPCNVNSSTTGVGGNNCMPAGNTQFNLGIVNSHVMLNAPRLSSHPINPDYQDDSKTFAKPENSS